MNILRKIYNYFRKLFTTKVVVKYSRNNPSQEYLFICGSYDGHKIRVPDNHETFYIYGKEQNIYYKTLFGNHNSLLAVYIHEDTNDIDLLDCLVKNYKPGP